MEISVVSVCSAPCTDCYFKEESEAFVAHFQSSPMDRTLLARQWCQTGGPHCRLIVIASLPSDNLAHWQLWPLLLLNLVITFPIGHFNYCQPNWGNIKGERTLITLLRCYSKMTPRQEKVESGITMATFRTCNYVSLDLGSKRICKAFPFCSLIVNKANSS